MTLPPTYRTLWTHDRRGYAGRLLSHQCVFAPLLGLFVFLAGLSSPTTVGSDRSSSLRVSSLRASSPSGPVAVDPVGWRRTADGWQHVSQWQSEPTRTMQEVIRDYQKSQRESDWARPLGWLGWSRTAIPVWILAAVQLTLIGTIVSLDAVGATLKRGCFTETKSPRRGNCAQSQPEA